MEVTRTQYPVGQGCFHAGRIEWGYPDSGSSDDFHYVYDCGSSSGSAVLQDAVAEWPSQVPRLDALFVSHLDTDHVNGIDRLLASVTSAPAVGARKRLRQCYEQITSGGSEGEVRTRLWGSLYGRRA